MMPKPRWPCWPPCANTVAVPTRAAMLNSAAPTIAYLLDVISVPPQNRIRTSDYGLRNCLLPTAYCLLPGVPTPFDGQREACRWHNCDESVAAVTDWPVSARLTSIDRDRR